MTCAKAVVLNDLFVAARHYAESNSSLVLFYNGCVISHGPTRFAMPFTRGYAILLPLWTCLSRQRAVVEDGRVHTKIGTGPNNENKSKTTTHDTPFYRYCKHIRSNLGDAGMNISTGGPHVLFFERDQQLTALLTSEFQLAGYECHAARTAVEVFDTIARFPVRILLVNLAQAAAGRREFWVALDTQRRGRGVQVFTYLCSNLAGYGPRDIDEHSQAQTADVELDGMLGLMSLVNAVRDRVPSASAPVPSGATNTQPRLPKVMPPPPPATPVLNSTQGNAGGSTSRTGPTVDIVNPQTARSGSGTVTTPPSTLNQQSYSEKIRAVLYPTPRAANTQAAPINATNMQATAPVEQAQTYEYEIPQQRTSQNMARTQTYNTPQTVQNSPALQQYDYDATALHQLAYGGQAGTGQESGLDQLSRLLQGRDARDATPIAYQASQAPSETREEQRDMSPPEQYVPSYAPASQVAPTTEAIGSQILRASPIEDLPLDRAPSGATGEGVRRQETRTSHGQHGPYGHGQAAQTQNATPLASISTLRATVQVPVTKATMPIPVAPPPQRVTAPITAPVEERVIVEMPSAPAPQPVVDARTVQQAVRETLVEYDGYDEGGARVEEEQTRERPATQRQKERNEEEHEVVGTNYATEEQVEPEPMPQQEKPAWKDIAEMGLSPSNAMLLDIVQSLPLMPAPPPQPTPAQTVSGRTMRTLGSVLLEGHLIPQNRLEVAQNVQRMLRGVDLNYQLGEILLMFKLLTPDQLLAASLVSYGMISTQQISALGRIRQELHAIGLEYDLESLLILFRMLTPDQLREVRSSWQG